VANQGEPSDQHAATGGTRALARERSKHSSRVDDPAVANEIGGTEDESRHCHHRRRPALAVSGKPGGSAGNAEHDRCAARRSGGHRFSRKPGSGTGSQAPIGQLHRFHLGRGCRQAAGQQSCRSIAARARRADLTNQRRRPADIVARHGPEFRPRTARWHAGIGCLRRQRRPAGAQSRIRFRRAAFGNLQHAAGFQDAARQPRRRRPVRHRGPAHTTTVRLQRLQGQLSVARRVSVDFRRSRSPRQLPHQQQLGWQVRCAAELLDLTTHLPYRRLVLAGMDVRAHSQQSARTGLRGRVRLEPARRGRLARQRAAGFHQRIRPEQRGSRQHAAAATGPAGSPGRRSRPHRRYAGIAMGARRQPAAPSRCDLLQAGIRLRSLHQQPAGP
jgi:hypothetical protein